MDTELKRRTPRKDTFRSTPLTSPRSPREHTKLAQAEGLLEEDILRAKEVFEAYDYDKSGHIDGTELRELLTDLQWGMDDKKIDELITLKVGDDKNRITVEKFTELYSQLMSLQPAAVRKQRTKEAVTVEDLLAMEADARAMFEAYDGGTGVLDVSQMRKVMKELHIPDPDGDDYEAAVLKHMEIADMNRDGHVDFVEFAGYRNAVLEHFYATAAEAARREVGDTNADPSPWAEWRFAD